MSSRMMEWASGVRTSMSRKKTQSVGLETSLRRCIGTTRLTFLGIGSMVGSGIFVLTGTVAKDITGPGIVVSYFISGFAALLSALFYAEFAARIPKAGSSYTYLYVSMGEIWGFIIGWNVILEAMIGVAALARAFSGTVDSLVNGAIQNGTMAVFGTIPVSWMSSYPDFLAALSVLIVMVLLIIGTNMSFNINSVFTIVYIAIIIASTAAGFYYADSANWQNSNHGGFLPYKVNGVIAGSAILFYSYGGFEIIASAGEETENPGVTIPRALLIAMISVTLLYCLAAASLTLMVPYYDINPSAAFPDAFGQRGLTAFKYVITAGSLLAISTSELSSAYGMARITYSMASDGLLFQFLAYVHPTLQTPIWATVVLCLCSATMALLFDIEELVSLTSIGMLLAFTMVAIGLIIIRYTPHNILDIVESLAQENETMPLKENNDKQFILISDEDIQTGTLKPGFKKLPLVNKLKAGKAVEYSTIGLLLSILGVDALVLYGFEDIRAGTWWAVLLLILLLAALMTAFTIIGMHQQDNSIKTFKVPGVPVVPGISMLINVGMMLRLPTNTWIRLIVWVALGMVIYLLYGIKHSRENMVKCESSRQPAYDAIVPVDTQR